MVDIFQDEWKAFRNESPALKFFRIWDAYGLLSSLVSCFTTKKSNPVTLSMYIFTFVGTLYVLRLTRKLRLASSTQKKRAASLKLAIFTIIFNIIGFFLSTYAFLETKSLDIIFVWVFHILMVAVEIVIVFVRVFQILCCKADEMADEILSSDLGDINLVTMGDEKSGVTSNVDNDAGDLESKTRVETATTTNAQNIAIEDNNGCSADLESGVDDMTGELSDIVLSVTADIEVVSEPQHKSI